MHPADLVVVSPGSSVVEPRLDLVVEKGDHQEVGKGGRLEGEKGAFHLVRGERVALVDRGLG